MLEQRPFPVAAGDRSGIRELWRQHAAAAVSRLENTGLPDFESARALLQTTLWPDTLRLFPEVAERLQRVDPIADAVDAAQAGVFDEYGLARIRESPSTSTSSRSACNSTAAARTVFSELSPT